MMESYASSGRCVAARKHGKYLFLLKNLWKPWCHIQYPLSRFTRRNSTVAADLLWCKLTQSGVLRFEGPDAQSFLQGQLTNNVTALDAARSQYAGYCTPKGRLLAVMLLWLHDGAHHMMLPRELCESVRKRLSMYILRSKVKALDVSPQFALFGLSGDGAAATVAQLAGAVPRADHDIVHGDGLSIVKLPHERYLLVAADAVGARVQSTLAAAATAGGDALWSALDIAAGIPNVYTATQEQFVPQAVNFDLIDALSFTKGCYPGQEIVARAHYLGRVKQRMVRAQVHAQETPAPGDKLFSEPFGNQASGMIVSALHSDIGNHEVLAVVQHSNLDKGSVHWRTPDGPQLRIVPLPYPVE